MSQRPGDGHKPSNWWAIESEPWRRIRAEMDAAWRHEAAEAFACAGLTLIGATLPTAPGDDGE